MSQTSDFPLFFPSPSPPPLSLLSPVLPLASEPAASSPMAPLASNLVRGLLASSLIAPPFPVVEPGPSSGLNSLAAVLGGVEIPGFTGQMLMCPIPQVAPSTPSVSSSSSAAALGVDSPVPVVGTVGSLSLSAARTSRPHRSSQAASSHSSLPVLTSSSLASIRPPGWSLVSCPSPLFPALSNLLLFFSVASAIARSSAVCRCLGLLLFLPLVSVAKSGESFARSTRDSEDLVHRSFCLLFLVS